MDNSPIFVDPTAEGGPGTDQHIHDTYRLVVGRIACSAPLNTQLQIKLRNRDKQQSNAGSQNRQAGPRSQGRNVVALRPVFCVALFLLSSILPGHAKTPNSKANPESAAAIIRPFKMHVPDSVLADLHHRLMETKWPDQLPGTGWEYGADIKKVRELAEYWQNGYDCARKKPRSTVLTSSPRKLMDSRFILSISAHPAPSAYR